MKKRQGGHMKIFNAGDAIQFAIKIEENGRMFYLRAADQSQAAETRDLFKSLADEETSHKAVFQEMLTRIENISPAEQYDGEYDLYLKNYVDGVEVFSEAAQSGVEDASKDALSAITFAMRMELDSILYYHEIDQLMGEKYHPIIKKIISEERKHFSKLSNQRKDYM